MEAFLAKIFATALALSQVTTAPDTVKTQFDRSRDQDKVAQLLRAGCAHMRKAFDIEDINLDDLIATAMDDSQAIAEENKVFRGINFADLETAYRQFCKNEEVPISAVDLGDVIDFYNNAARDLPDHTKLKAMKLPGASIVLDGTGQPFAEVFEENQRRVWIPLADIPEQVQKAFLAAEDKRFYQHKGIDERGLIRAFVGNLAQSGRPQGGSTITQQIVKNLLVGNDLTYERKIREMIVASRIEQSLSKAEILELYLNSVYLGRGSWGIEIAARSYFGKPASDLQLEEGALLAGLVKGPNYFSPDRRPERARERLAYVMSRLREDGATSTDEPPKETPPLPTLLAYERPRRDIGFYFMDQVGREAKAIAGIDAITANSYTVRSTINPRLQRAVEGALQEGLSRYERNAGRVEFGAAEANLAQAVQHLEASKTSDTRPAWQRALANARPPLYDVQWTPAVLVEKASGKKGEAWRVGLPDGRVLPLAIDNAAAKRKLMLYDVVLVRIAEGKGKADTRAELRVRPMVQGAVVVVENKTGRILAMTGGFSYPLSQLNRATHAVRQPGSAIKPLSYLAALGKGLQPNTLMMDKSITLPPISGSRVRDKGYWTPRNYDGRSGATLTLRQAIENSRNLATVRLLDGGIENKPEASLSRLCELALEAQIYRECLSYYPFVLGAHPVRPIDLAAFYAAIANEGVRPSPHVVDSIEHAGQTIYRHDQAPSVTINSIDRAAFYQLKTMLQGVLARGTARAISGLAPYVAGKTGTSDDENDAWFIGFTNDVTVAVWIGYDNADGKRRTLGSGATGGHVAVPIFEPVIEAVWTNVAPRTALAPPSPEAKRHLACTSVGLDSGKIQSGRGKVASECFRVDAKGRILDTQYRLIARDSAHTRRDGDESIPGDKRERGLSASNNSSERAYTAEYEWSGDVWRRGPQWDSRADNIQRWGSEQRWDSGQRWDNEQRWNNVRRYRDDQRDWRRADPTYIWGGHRHD
jgi:penicillin-binding protein 1A